MRCFIALGIRLSAKSRDLAMFLVILYFFMQRYEEWFSCTHVGEVEVLVHIFNDLILGVLSNLLHVDLF